MEDVRAYSSDLWYTDQLHGGMGEAVSEAEIGFRALCHDGPEDSGKAQSYHLELVFRRAVGLIKMVALELHPVIDGLVMLRPIGGVVLSGMRRCGRADPWCCAHGSLNIVQPEASVSKTGAVSTSRNAYTLPFYWIYSSRFCQDKTTLRVNGQRNDYFPIRSLFREAKAYHFIMIIFGRIRNV